MDKNSEINFVRRKTIWGRARILIACILLGLFIFFDQVGNDLHKGQMSYLYEVLSIDYEEIAANSIAEIIKNSRD